MKKNEAFCRCSRAALILIGLSLSFGLCGLLSGCMFSDLKQEIAEAEKSILVKGNIEPDSVNYESVIVILFSEQDGKSEVAAYTVPEDTGYFSFLVKEGGYQLLAFEDANHNLAYDTGEKYNLVGAAELLKRIAPDGRSRIYNPIDIWLSGDGVLPSGTPSAIETLTFNMQALTKVGRLASLGDEIFNVDHGSLGYWKPLTFLKKFGYGVYFLETYDPQKIPVLFVHGAVGTPVGWGPLINSLNRSRYQPWLYYYPSGVRLDLAAKGLNNVVEELYRAHNFKKLIITAHSMGGLVSRAFILKSRHENRRDFVKGFISISTPWNGHRMSASGVKQAPVAVPSWYDMVPNSQFIQSLYRKPLAPEVDFSLIFSYRGDCSIFLTNNDGTVEIASQLDYRAPNDASHIFGFDEDHDSILTSQGVLDYYKRLLDLNF